MSIAGALRSNHAEEFKSPCPAGEHNWKSRATFANTLADALETNPNDVPAGIAVTLEPFYNNLLDCAISERTTLSIAACRLLGALPKILGKDIHPHLDRFLPVLIRQCASTKAVAQKSASAAISNIVVFSPYSSRSLWHVCQTFDDKYSAPKLYAPIWLKLIIQNYHPALNPDRDYEMIARAISIGLEEADNNVRVNCRAVFWEYQKIDPAGAEDIISKLNTHAKTALINDPNNPDKPKVKSKKPTEPTQGLAQIRQQAKERMKAKDAERSRVVSASTITSQDFPFGALNMGDDKQVPPIPPNNTKKTSRPLLSAPVRRTRIVATPIHALPHPSRRLQRPMISYDRAMLTPEDRPLSPPKEIPIPSDGLDARQRHDRQALDNEMTAMKPLVPAMAKMWEVQDVEKNTQIYHVYPDLNIEDGQVEDARRAFKKGLEYLSKDSLDQLGFRKLRKLFETFGRNLIINRDQYDQMFTLLIPRIGTFDELYTQPLHEIENENNLRYIRQSVLAMVNILVHDYPFEWSLRFQGPAIASMLIARCSYSPNCDWHSGAPYIHNINIVTQLLASAQIIIDACSEPVAMIDNILQVIHTCEEFLLLHAPQNSEFQSSWGSWNPYCKENRTDATIDGFLPSLPKNLKNLKVDDPKPIPIKLPLLMEAGIRMIKALLIKVHNEEYLLGEEREDMLADFAKHLLENYNVFIRRHVMEYLQVLSRNFQSESRFWSHFPKDSDRNLIHYYLQK